MPPRQPQNPPEPPQTPHPGDVEEERIQSLDDRFSAIEDRQERQEGLLQQILSRLPGKPSSGSPGPTAAPDPDEGKPIADLVREGVERLEAEKAAKAKTESEAAERKDHADRLRKLEEARPREVAATPAGKGRSAVQKWFFGIDDTRR